MCHQSSTTWPGCGSIHGKSDWRTASRIFLLSLMKCRVPPKPWDPFHIAYGDGSQPGARSSFTFQVGQTRYPGATTHRRFCDRFFWCFGVSCADLTSRVRTRRIPRPISRPLSQTILRDSCGAVVSEKEPGQTFVPQTALL